ncbi:MAG: hypothetical protein QOD06_2293, partial [Candidatus Binatota bacterium]|nr:hypothetical protein [Candidatus Binatota bacterium]
HMGQMGGHMHDGPHMRFTAERTPSEADLARAREVLRTMRAAITPYQDAEKALEEGHRIFLPTVPQEVYHFVHYPHTAQEYAGRFDVAHPGSLLYVKEGADRWRLVGAMYSAPEGSTEDQLDRLIPLGVSRWHAHVNVCLPEGVSLDDLTRGEIGAGNAHLAGTLDAGRHGAVADTVNRQYGFMADGRFGFEGRIADRPSCEGAGGKFLPQAYGWMVHVYPFAGDDLKTAFGTDVP